MLNLAVRFLLELCLLAATGYWGFKTQSTWPMKILLGVGLPVVLAVLWGLFVAPRAVRPLHGPAHFVLELGLLSLGGAALFAADRPALGWAFTIALVVSTILKVVWKQ
jgi:hypothetical protein